MSSEVRAVVKSGSSFLGLASVVVGAVGVFFLSIVLSPLAFILGAVACIRGEILVGGVGIILASLGLQPRRCS